MTMVKMGILPILLHRHTRRALWQFLGKAPLIELGDGLPLQLIAFVQERQPKRIPNIA